MTWGLALMVVGILAVIEALLILIFPKPVMKMTKNAKTLKKAGWWEFVIAIIIFVIGMNI